MSPIPSFGLTDSGPVQTPQPPSPRAQNTEAARRIFDRDELRSEFPPASAEPYQVSQFILRLMSRRTSPEYVLHHLQWGGETWYPECFRQDCPAWDGDPNPRYMRALEVYMWNAHSRNLLAGDESRMQQQQQDTPVRTLRELIQRGRREGRTSETASASKLDSSPPPPPPPSSSAPETETHQGSWECWFPLYHPTDRGFYLTGADLWSLDARQIYEVLPSEIDDNLAKLVALDVVKMRESVPGAPSWTKTRTSRFRAVAIVAMPAMLCTITIYLRLIHENPTFSLPAKVISFVVTFAGLWKLVLRLANMNQLLQKTVEFQGRDRFVGTGTVLADERRGLAVGWRRALALKRGHSRDPMKTAEFVDCH